MSRLSATMRSMNRIDRGVERQRRVAAVQRLQHVGRQRGQLLVDDVVLVQRDHAEAPARAPEVLAVRVDADRVLRELAEQRSEARDEGAVDVVGQDDQVGPLLENPADGGDRLAAERDRVGVSGVDDEERLDRGIEQRRQVVVGELPALLLPRGDAHDVQPVVLEVRHLEVGREDRRDHRDGVAGVQQAVRLERLEEVAHRGRAAFDRVEVEPAGGPRLAAHRPLQVLADDLLVVDEHPVGHRVVVADDRVDQFVDECVGVEAELLDRPGDDPLQERSAGHGGALVEPGREARGHPWCFRHAPDARRADPSSAALGNRELSEEKERRAGIGGDPVGFPLPAFRYATWEAFAVLAATLPGRS